MWLGLAACGGNEGTGGGNPLLHSQDVAPSEASFRGHVRQRISAGGYSYLEIDDGSAVHWVATMGRGVDEGRAVTVRTFAARDDFASRRLGRSFDRVLFGVVHEAG